MSHTPEQIPDGQFYAYNPGDKDAEVISKRWIRVNHDGDFFELRTVEGGIEIRLSGMVVHQMITVPQVSNSILVLGIPTLDNGSIETKIKGSESASQKAARARQIKPPKHNFKFNRGE